MSSSSSASSSINKLVSVWVGKTERKHLKAANLLLFILLLLLLLLLFLFQIGICEAWKNRADGAVKRMDRRPLT